MGSMEMDMRRGAYFGVYEAVNNRGRKSAREELQVTRSKGMPRASETQKGQRIAAVRCTRTLNKQT